MFISMLEIFIYLIQHEASSRGRCQYSRFSFKINITDDSKMNL